ncbi:VOC family protein [Streptomyces sp. NPDC003717]|uniref:VOC family protein n=1 Tax=Streptomyces sp. NPDC003717 TaxID=3154276 RepID=UPI0033B8E8A1
MTRPHRARDGRDGRHEHAGRHEGFEGEGPTWMFHQPASDLPAGENRLMLDLGGEEDWAEQADRVAALGAERVSGNERDGVRWVVLRDPEGDTFRIFAPRPD